MAETDIDTDIYPIFEVGFEGVTESTKDQITIEEITLGESLLTPGLQTSVRVHSYIHTLSPDPKNLDEFKNSLMTIRIEKPILKRFRHI